MLTNLSDATVKWKGLIHLNLILLRALSSAGSPKQEILVGIWLITKVIAVVSSLPDNVTPSVSSP